MVRIPLAWLQLFKSKGRLAAAVAGISFAAVLMLAHMGVSEALFESAVLVHDHLNGEIFITSAKYQILIRSQTFTDRRLLQAQGVPGVESTASLYLGFAPWTNPWTHENRDVFLLAFEPREGVLNLPGIESQIAALRAPDAILFDNLSRPEYGPVGKSFKETGPFEAQVGTRKMRVVGLFELGTSFGVDGSVITSDLNFLRLRPGTSEGLVSVGVIKLKPGADPADVLTALRKVLPEDVAVLPRETFRQNEIDYWANSTPIGFTTLLGVVMGWIVGAVIVYQILYSDVSEHLAEYATLKAMGYKNSYLMSVVMQEAVIISVLGFLPSLLLAEVVYAITHAATLLPIAMTPRRALIVYAYTLGMCLLSGLLAGRRLRSADPASIF